jgi:hypothetical protein
MEGGVPIGADGDPHQTVFLIFYTKHLCGIGVGFQSGADSHARRSSPGSSTARPPDFRAIKILLDMVRDIEGQTEGICRDRLLQRGFSKAEK